MPVADNIAEKSCTVTYRVAKNTLQNFPRVLSIIAGKLMDLVEDIERNKVQVPLDELVKTGSKVSFMDHIPAAYVEPFTKVMEKYHIQCYSHKEYDGSEKFNITFKAKDANTLLQGIKEAEQKCRAIEQKLSREMKSCRNPAKKAKLKEKIQATQNEAAKYQEILQKKFVEKAMKDKRTR